MTKKVYYERVGRKYVPVREYDSLLMDSFPAGTHMVVCHPGGRSYRYNIDPAFAPMIAAGRYCEDVISTAVMKAHEVRPYRNQALTTEQREAWDTLMASLPDKGRYIEWPSAREVAEAAVKALSDEALKMLDNPSVKLAWENLMMVAALAKDHHSS
jgi:hypothetical protein